jgi:hypothetical protein
MSSRTIVTCDVCGNSLPEHLSVSPDSITLKPGNDRQVVHVDLCERCSARITGRGLSRILQAWLAEAEPQG